MYNKIMLMSVKRSGL